ncbi:MAG: efflux RND transporter periplasmic adaptor subunit [Deltaproteobacteria bacterium]|jgi:HlyD family secretion protein|nr:efflux RND transporter periplasmic adaptor subunit [Deltaproteobacteria bacterium]
MKKTLLLALIVCLAGLWYYHQRYEPAGSAKALTLYGNVDIRELSLGFRVSGRLEKMLLEEGDRVSKGTLLAELEKTPFVEEYNVRAAQIREIEANLLNAEKNLLRRQTLLKNGSITASDYDDTLAGRDSLLAKMDTAKAQLSQAQTSLVDTALYSPSEGTILTRVREPGAIVGAGDIVYTISLDNPIWIRAYIDEPNLGRIRPGQQVEIVTDSGGRYAGQIGFISPRAEFTPKTVETAVLRTDLVYRLRVIVTTADSSLRQGMPVTIFFEDETL